MRRYGTIELCSVKNKWIINAEPHVILRIKRIWKDRGSIGSVSLDATPSNAADIEWLLSRYPMDISEEDLAFLKKSSAGHQETILRVQDYIGHHVPPPPFETALPPREYQAYEGAIVLDQGRLLVADDLGLGKTMSAITVMTRPEALPSVVVTMTHLPGQWQKEILKFAPNLKTHIIKTGPLYPLAGALTKEGQVSIPGLEPDVVILSYSKLAKWAQVLGPYANYVVFDEAQELRRMGSQKYEGAEYLAKKCKYKMQLTATPCYNYGDEIYALMNILAPGEMGTWYEFVTQWCVPIGSNKYKVKNPQALGSWLRDMGLMVRHTRKQVGRELPEVISVVHEIDADAQELEKIEGRAGELARILLDKGKREKVEKLMAGGELERIMRQQTGIAKAPFVAEFVKLLVESGEKVIVACWHHSVYDIIEEKLKPIRVVRYTGKENPEQKARAFQAFTNDDDVNILLISLRAGAGLDGLQNVAHVVVFAELDWADGVHRQVIGRVHRDGQGEPVLVYYLVADSGSDPTVASVLGVKRQQAAGIVDPGRAAEEIFGQVGGEDRIHRLAEDWIQKHGKNRG